MVAVDLPTLDHLVLLFRRARISWWFEYKPVNMQVVRLVISEYSPSYLRYGDQIYPISVQDEIATLRDSMWLVIANRTADGRTIPVEVGRIILPAGHVDTASRMWADHSVRTLIEHADNGQI